MRTFINGSGADSTAAVQAHLAAHRQLHLADLYVVTTAPNYQGQYMDRTFLLTDYPSSLLWSYKGTFAPAVIQRTEVESKIGLAADTLDVNWSPQDSDILANDGAVTLLSVLQGFGCGIFDDGTLEVWRCVMPTIGDCDSLGAYLIFAGRIGDIEPDRLKAKLTINSRLEVLNQQVPTNLIEPTNIIAQYTTGQVPTNGPPSFVVLAGSTRHLIYADPVSAPGGYIPASGIYDWGYLKFAAPAKLGGTFRAIRSQLYGFATMTKVVQIGPVASPMPSGQTNPTDWEFNSQAWRTEVHVASTAPLKITFTLPALPAGTLPTGMIFEFEAVSQFSTPDSTLTSLQVLDSGGSPIGVPKSNTTPFPTAWTGFIYGDNNDTWGVDPEALALLLASGSISFALSVDSASSRCFVRGPEGGPFSLTVQGTYQVPWAATTALTLGTVIVDSNGNLEKVTTAGTTGGSEPTWNVTEGGTTTDGSVTWTNLGAANHAFYLYEPLPFAPSAGDHFSAFIPVPRDLTGAIAKGSDYAGFPYVPSQINSPVVIT